MPWGSHRGGGTLPGPAGRGGTLAGGGYPGGGGTLAGGYPGGGYPGQVPPPARSGLGGGVPS